jgi:hypothetical protein
MSRIFLLLLYLLVSSAIAQPSKSIEQLRKEEDFRRATAALDDLDSKLNTIIKKRTSDCEMAVGYKPFCNCILKDLPVAWSFNDYVSIATRSKEENGYSKMDKELRSAYDKVIPIRDFCVKTINAKP